MKTMSWLSRNRNRESAPTGVRRLVMGAGAAILAMATGIAAAQSPVAQIPASATQPVAPQGYSLHEAIDLGGHMVSTTGSGAMYDTLVNEQSGPRVLGETFQLHALPGAQHTPIDSLTAFGSGFGGDPYDFAKIDFFKGRIYDFSGMFRRDRQYFDYDLLGNPNIPSGQSIPIGPTTAPVGSYAWPQVLQSPFLYNTVRRMTDTNLTLAPLSKVTYRAGYSQNIFEGPSLSPSGYQVAGSYDLLLQENQRNSADNFYGALDWKILPQTRLTFEEQVDHYKEDSWFSADPNTFRFQEPDGTKVALLADYDALTPYKTISPTVTYSYPACNSNSTGGTPPVSAPNVPGGLPIINPACNVLSGYQRYQPTRLLFPTEIFRFQSSSIRTVSMNGDIRYTNANMSLPSYYDNFQGLAGTSREITYTATASAKREVFAADYGIEWQVTQKLGLSEAISYSNLQQPGTATMTSGTTVTTPAVANEETITYPTLTTTPVAAGKSTFEGSGSIGVPLPDFFGQKFTNNNLTATWDGWSRASLSLSWLHNRHVIAEGIPHSAALAVGATTNGTVTINQNGGIFGASLRPTDKWDLNGTAEVLYADNVFTPVAPRQLQHYRVHTLYRARAWATFSGAYNDMELHNNTNNNQADIAPAFSGSATGAAYAGPLDHVAHSRVASLGAQIFPNERYGLDFDYAYSDVYTATNICYLGGSNAAAGLPAAAPANGAVCPSTSAGRSGTYDFGPVRDFEDAPTQSGSVAFSVAPTTALHSNIGYRISSVSGSRFYNDPRDVAGSLVSTYQTPFVDLAYTVHKWVWKAEYNYYGYGEGGPSGAAYCSTSDPVPTSKTNFTPIAPAVVACNSLAGVQTGMTISPAGETAPRNFHANNITLGMHYEF